MRITVVNGERQVSVKVKGSSAKALARAEAAATRLLMVGHEPTPTLPFGYSVTSDHDVAASEPDEDG
ncbi:hypothetical protein ACWDBF_21460 [Streptomyces angustmyceticus]